MNFQNYLENIIKIPILFFFILRSYYRQKKFIEKTILKDIEEVKKGKDQSLNEKDFRKIKTYYGIAVPIIGEMYCLLRGTKLSNSERESLTYLGSSTGLFDDFFDEKDTPEKHIKELITQPTEALCRNSHEQLFVRFYSKVLSKANSTFIKEYSLKVFDAQILSKEQTDPHISPEEILFITKEKGGHSILFYRTALNNDISDSEKDMLHKVGFLGQLENDLFDIYKDYQEGVFTLVTTEKSMTKLRSEYISLLNECFKLIEKTNFRKKDKKNFSRFIAVIACRGIVCLDQLIKLEENGLFEVSKHGRKDLICDMGKIKNIVPWINYYLNWNIELR